MATVRIEASEGAVQWAKELCEGEQVSLDSIKNIYEQLQNIYEQLQIILTQTENDLKTIMTDPLEHTPLLVGSAEDHTWVTLECQRLLQLPRNGEGITLAEVREALRQLTDQQATMIARSLTGKSREHTLDECAAVIIGLCPHDIEEMFKIAEETWSHAGIELGRAHIIASVIMADRNRLNAGDITELKSASSPQSPSMTRQEAPARHGQSICPAVETITLVDEELGAVSIQVPLCGKHFTPTRMGAKYGCQACGEIAHKAKIWLTESVEQVRRKTLPTINAAPAFKIPLELKAQCNCGEQPTGMLVHAAA